MEDIEKKFKDLSTTFQHHYNNMMKGSPECQSGVPQWKHYKQLMFLQSCGVQEESANDLPPSSAAASQGDSRSILPSSGPVSFPPRRSTSSVPSTMTVKNYWTEERERALIAFYSGKHNTKSSLKIMKFDQDMNLMMAWLLVQSIAVCGTGDLRTTTTVSSDSSC